MDTTLTFNNEELNDNDLVQLEYMIDKGLDKTGLLQMFVDKMKEQGITEY